MLDYKRYVADQMRQVTDINRLLDSDSFAAKALGRWRMQNLPLMFIRKAWQPVSDELECAKAGRVFSSLNLKEYVKDVSQRQGQ